MPAEEKQRTKRHQPEHHHLAEKLTVQLDNGVHHRTVDIRKAERHTLILDFGGGEPVFLTLSSNGAMIVTCLDVNDLAIWTRLK